MNQMNQMNTNMQRREREILTPSQRFGEFVSILVTSLFLGFFVYHQVTHTGFFTAAFGPLEMLFFYGPMLLAMAAALTRALWGRRNPARPVEVVSNGLLAVGALWLLIVFPFSFVHLADALPPTVRFLLSWVNDAIGRIALYICLIVCPIAAIVVAWQFFSHWQREPGNPLTRRSAT